SKLRIEALQGNSRLAEGIRFPGGDRWLELWTIDLHRCFASPRFSQFVIARINGHASQPAREILVRPNLLDSRKELQEDILRQILHILTRPEKPANQPENHG